MNEAIKRMNAYFAAQTARCAQREKALLADDRGDEANFEKIQANVYDIFRTILSVAQQESGGDEAAARRFFAAKLKTIPANWYAAYTQAESHGDAVRAQIERVKLDALREIEAQFAAEWEETV